MTNRILDQLAGDEESMLLMYLSDELPPEDRAVVERRLRDEPALHERLGTLRATMETLDAAMAGLDEADPLPGSEAAAVRKVGRAVAQWRVEREVVATRRIAPARKELRFPWWSYPLAAAAAVTFAFLAWWRTLPDPAQMAGSNMPIDPSTATSITRSSATAGMDDENLVDEMVSGEPVQFVALDPLAEIQPLSQLEQQIQTLQILRESMQ